MTVIDYFSLGKSQYEVDFVNIDVDTDIPLFIDPYFLSIREDELSINASNTIRSFFAYLISLVRSGQVDEARELFSHLHEPNETCLGMSLGKPSGRGIGSQNADDIFNSLLSSKAMKTGVLQHLEDAKFFVKGVNKDKTSDMATNIIRKYLIKYTQNQCKLHGISTSPSIPTGDTWNSSTLRWESGYDDMLVINEKKILLVPKSIVSFASQYIPQQYAQHFVLNYLQDEHLRLNSSLVQTRKDKKTKFVTKKDIRLQTYIKEGRKLDDKDFLADFTHKHPEVFQKFKDAQKEKLKEAPQHEYSHDDIYKVINYLIEQLGAISSGRNTASQYHRLVTSILELIFYPQLINPILEQEIHEGRKRIDIVFDNADKDGFFNSLINIHGIPANYIFVECKNYNSDVTNPELDQLSGRFSPRKGKIGLLLCRKIDDMDLFLKRCSDTYNDDRGIIIPLVDEDLVFLLKEIRQKRNNSVNELLNGKLRKIIL